MGTSCGYSHINIQKKGRYTSSQMTKNPSDNTTSNAIQSIIAHLTPFIAHIFQVGALTKANRPRLQNFQKA